MSPAIVRGYGTRRHGRVIPTTRVSPCRLVIEQLEDRRLMSGIPAWFDSPWRGYDTGTFPDSFSPNSLAVGDMDKDGDVDAVVGRFHYWKPGVSILMNLGDGTYDQPVHYDLPINKSVGEIALRDIDADRDLDVLATVPDAYNQSNKLAVWRNLGNGQLGPRTEYTTGPGPMGLAVADFTGDRLPDVVTANPGYNWDGATVSLLKHNGLKGAAAAYLPAVSFTVGPNVEHVVAADLNGDKRPDIAVGRNELIDGYYVGIISVMFNDGTGGFRSPTHYTTISTGASRVIGVADLDNDGDQDLLGSGNSGGFTQVAILRNTGNGTFTSPELHSLGVFAPSVRHFTSADLNGDGFRDIVASCPDGYASNGWYVLMSNGAGGYQPAVGYRSSPTNYATAAADADKDGDLDVLTVSYYGQAITVHNNPGVGLFPVPTAFSAGFLTEAMDAADIDRDGDLDIAANDDVVRILRNNGDGTFAPYTSHSMGINAAAIKLRDLNGDGYPDLLGGPDAEFPSYHFSVALNNGDGTFAPAVVNPVFACNHGLIDAFDLDNDGDRDVVLTTGPCGGFTPAHIYIARNDGNASFTLVEPIADVTITMSREIAAADLDHDGNLDLVTNANGVVGVFRGNGDLTFKPALLSGPGGTKWTLADLNRDGKLDIAMIDPPISIGTVKILVSMGNGDGTFGAPVGYWAAGSSQGFTISNDIDAADINADGYPDLVVSNPGTNDISFFLNNGDGTLGVHQRYGAGYAPRLSIFRDFTGDRVPDVASVVGLPPSGGGNAVVVLRGLDGSGRASPGDQPLANLSGKLSRPQQTDAEASEQTGRDSLAPTHDEALSPRPLGRSTRTLPARLVAPDWIDSLFVESLFAV